MIGAIYVVRLLFLQALDDSYTAKANQNVLRFITQYPARGLVYDRNGKLLVYNEAVYDLVVVPRQVKGIDTLLFCQLVGITRSDFEKRMEKARNYSTYAPSIFEKQISKEDFGPLQEKLYRFKGFYVQSRSLRRYPKSIAAHVLGYIGEVNGFDIQQNSYYVQGDYIGKSGLEKSYENVLRGKKGSKIIMVDVHNREKGPFRNGMYDTAAVAGENLYSTIDMGLQEYAEQLMHNKRGSIVAIEPSTGEVLAFVSAPYYDPNLLVGRVRGSNYVKLATDIGKPLFNRALMASYPPGSIFKIAQAMTALELGVIHDNTGFACDKSLVGCHNHPSAANVESAIKMSCNPYFQQVFKRIIIQHKYNATNIDSQYGLSVWRSYMLRFGFGKRLSIDLPDVKKGRIPDTAFYNRWYGANRWNFWTIRSLSIGQGEVEVIPLQMANFAATVANRGFYYTPHLVRSWGNKNEKNPEFQTKNYTHISEHFFNIAAQGMYDVVHEAGGTGSRARISNIVVCGKTGTAENIGVDHSVFIAFAPMDNPKIAISVYVENAGFGGTWAAPIASLMIEKYIRGEVLRKEVEKNVIETNPCQPLPLVRINKKKK